MTSTGAACSWRRRSRSEGAARRWLRVPGAWPGRRGALSQEARTSATTSSTARPGRNLQNALRIFLPLAVRSRYPCAWKMAYFSTATAPERRNVKKNRVWDFFRLSNETHPAKRRQPLQPRRKIRPTPTKTVSGIPYWPSRDPIGERGGINLYAILSNNCLSRVDLLGRDPAPPAANTFKVKRAGEAEITKVADSMKKVCAQEKCRDRCKCSKEDCEKEAQEIARLYIDAFNATVKDEPNLLHRHGGALCYEWAEAVQKGVAKAKSKCWTASWVGIATVDLAKPEFSRNHNFIFMSLGNAVEMKPRMTPVKDCGIALDPWDKVTAEAYPPEGENHDWNYFQTDGQGYCWTPNGKLYKAEVSDYVDP